MRRQRAQETFIFLFKGISVQEFWLSVTPLRGLLFFLFLKSVFRYVRWWQAPDPDSGILESALSLETLIKRGENSISG